MSCACVRAWVEGEGYFFKNTSMSIVIKNMSVPPSATPQSKTQCHFFSPPQVDGTTLSKKNIGNDSRSLHTRVCLPACLLCVRVGVLQLIDRWVAAAASFSSHPLYHLLLVVFLAKMMMEKKKEEEEDMFPSRSRRSRRSTKYCDCGTVPPFRPIR